MNKQKKILFFLTNFFPFNNGEPYIEPEFEYLLKTFDEIFIYSFCEKKTFYYPIPIKVKATNILLKINLISKLFSLRFLFKSVFWKELNFIKNNLNESIDINKIIILLMDLHKGYALKKNIIKKIEEKIYLNDKVFYYSFWNDYRAFAGVLIKDKFPQIKVFSRAHGWDVYFERNLKNYLPLKLTMAEKMDAIFFVSAFGQKYALNKIGNFKTLKISYLGKKKMTLFHSR